VKIYRVWQKDYGMKQTFGIKLGLVLYFST